jgi:hypothetical protein
MVKALHRAGIEVLLDVVFNHTAEGDDQGPTPGDIVPWRDAAIVTAAAYQAAARSVVVLWAPLAGDMAAAPARA